MQIAMQMQQSQQVPCVVVGGVGKGAARCQQRGLVAKWEELRVSGKSGEETIRALQLVTLLQPLTAGSIHEARLRSRQESQLCAH